MSNIKIQKVLGLDLGSNSIGWALLENNDGRPQKLIDIGSRIFNKSVEEQTPTPKNVERRNARLTRRILQRRSRRKQRMLNYLISLELLPEALRNNPAPEIILNDLGDPYFLRKKALDEPLEKNELGRVFLHLVQRRGFLSNRKTLLGDLVDEPDVQVVLAEVEAEEDTSSETAKEETEFKKDIAVLRQAISQSGCRTLGEYLASVNQPECKRNRSHSGGHLRTDRQMYHEELNLIWQKQSNHHSVLTTDVRKQIEDIIFLQRPIKLRSDRIGKCSLEPKKNRIAVARLEYQRYRYLLDVNNLQIMQPGELSWKKLSPEQSEKLTVFFESNANVSFSEVKNTLGLKRNIKINLQEGGNKKLKGNVTAATIRKVFPEWGSYNQTQQYALVEDLLTIHKKSALKERLRGHWGLSSEQAIQLCMLEFEPGHGNLSCKAINKLLPYLEQGMLFNEARVAAGYGYEIKESSAAERLGVPPETANPIVNKGLHELRRLVNAIIAEYGKPDVIRVEMARDLEMNTRRYQENLKQQTANTKANDQATEAFQEVGEKNPHLGLRHYPSHTDKLKYRLWLDQNKRCAYSNQSINLTSLFTGEVEIDHILPFSESLDDSYMNKVICLAAENRSKGQQTPVDAFNGNPEKWEQIRQSLNEWCKGPKLKSKRDRFFMTASDVQKRDFLSSQLNDTRYISRLAVAYLKLLGSDVTTCKGVITAQVRHWWGLDSLLGEKNSEKDRTDHRHHAVDAAVISTIDRGFYQKIVRTARELENTGSGLGMNDLKVDAPWDDFRDDLAAKLETMIVAHTPSRKLSGALHEASGTGFIEGQGTVYRKLLSPDMTLKQVGKIIDPQVRIMVLEHLEIYDNDPKKAFAENITVFHIDGKTPIRRVRLLQSKTTSKKLAENKFPVRNREGKVFKWLAYGNLHHVEIIHDLNSGNVKGEFVTMMEASQRAKGIGMPRQPIVKTEHGPDKEFLMALHINDLVSIEQDGIRDYFRVQQLDAPNKRVKLRLHTASTLDNSHETLKDQDSTIHALIEIKLRLHKVNPIGKLIE